MRSFLLGLTSLATVFEAAKELTPKNFDDVVFNSGKGTFIKFLAPWWGHCKKLKPDWDRLAKAVDKSTVEVVDVDCTAAGQPLCQKYGIQGYPTLKYKTGSSNSLKDYQGGRTYSDLKSFVDKTFKAACDIKTRKGCNPQEITYLKKMEEKTPEELTEEKSTKTAELKELQAEKKKTEKAHKEFMKKIKKKERAVKKAVALLKQLEKTNKGKANKKDEL